MRFGLEGFLYSYFCENEFILMTRGIFMEFAYLPSQYLPIPIWSDVTTGHFNPTRADVRYTWVTHFIFGRPC